MSEPAHQLVPTNSKVLTKVSEALEGYKLRHPDLTEDHFGAFALAVKARVMQHVPKWDAHEDRKRRRAALNALAKEHNVQFFIKREYHEVAVRVSDLLNLLDTMKDGQELIDYLVNAERSGLINNGGTVYASYIENIEGQAYVTIAAAFCNPKDTFDKLAGKEQAIERLLNGPNAKEPFRLDFSLSQRKGLKYKLMSLLSDQNKGLVPFIPQDNPENG